jgi:hypothetical protein
MRRLWTAARDESGIALVAAIMLIGLLTTVSLGLYSLTSADGTSSVADVQTNNAMQAATSGLNVYIADLTEDTGFYLDYIAEGEARRTYLGTQYPTTAGANATANVALSPSWPRTATWTYPSDITTDPGWRTVSGTNYQYLLEIFPDTTTFNDVRVIAVGRPVPSTQFPASNKTYYRAVEAEVSVLTISDFQMISASNIAYGNAATTNGWIYGTFEDDSDATNAEATGNYSAAANISGPGSGTAWTTSADLFTEDTSSSYSGKITLTNNAREYSENSSPSVRTVISEPITMQDIRQSNQIAPISGGEGSLQLDATSSGLILSPSALGTSYTPNAWWLKFTSSGFTVWACNSTSKSGGYYALYDNTSSPSCSTQVGGTHTLPATGYEIYSPEDVIVSGTVNGQVTVYAAGGGTATTGNNVTANGDIIIGGNISYQTVGSDVLGLIANNDVVMACWEPNSPFTWEAATIALNGGWYSSGGTGNGYDCNASGRALTFTGSTATDQGGGVDGSFLTSRTYNYDSTLRYLPPPDFPQIPAALKVMYERQIASP